MQCVHVAQLSLCVQSAVFRDKDKLYKELALAEKEELRVQEKNQMELLANASYDPESPTYLVDDDGTLPPSVFEQLASAHCNESDILRLRLVATRLMRMVNDSRRICQKLYK